MKTAPFIPGLLIALSLLSSVEAGGQRWGFIAKDDEGLWVYDLESVEPLAHGRTKVRTLKLYEEEAALAAAGKYGKAYEKLDRVLAEWEIDCLQRAFHLRGAVFFSKDDAVIERYSAGVQGPLPFEEIPPDSNLERLRRKTCR